MNIFLSILAILAIGIAFYFYKILTGKIIDRDGDFIPDVIEDKAAKSTRVIKKAIADVNDIVTKPITKRGRPVGSQNKSKK